ncbi:MAG: SdiA-regulated domain-containing protein [Ferruginibacter sp.]
MSCRSAADKDKFENTDMYDLTSPTIINLPQELDEISGIAYYPKDTSVFAIIDEDGLLFKIPILHPENTKQWSFDHKRDYEDVILRDSTFYVLVSNGNIIKVDFVNDSIVTQKIKFDEPSKKVNEFETLYYDDSVKNMVLMCKSCDADKKKKVSSFIYEDSTNNFASYISLDPAAVAKKIGEDGKFVLKPSAAAINPVTKDLYIVCSVNKLLLITDREGNLKNAYKLNPKIYKQPEGITFTPAGDMIISNEVFLGDHATLLIFKNKKKAK